MMRVWESNEDVAQNFRSVSNISLHLGPGRRGVRSFDLNSVSLRNPCSWTCRSHTPLSFSSPPPRYLALRSLARRRHARLERGHTLLQAPERRSQRVFADDRLRSSGTIERAEVTFCLALEAWAEVAMGFSGLRTCFDNNLVGPRGPPQ